MQNKKAKAFSIIELIIGIFVFSLGITAVYMLISSSLSVNIYNQNQLIASNLARESVELVRNIRDSNYATYHRWDQLGPHLSHTDSDNFFKQDSQYIVENNYGASAVFPIKIKDISSGFGEGKSKINTAMQNYKLCLDSENRYTYDCSGTNKETHFYRFVEITKLKYDESGVTTEIEDAYKLTSKVIWISQGYHEFSIDTIITDWKRL